MLAFMPERMLQLLAQQTPSRRNTSPEDVAEAIVFLCSSQATQIHGVNLPVSGGMAMG
jgi:3-oxoacyl-[acyl-carrier protein] reductase